MTHSITTPLPVQRAYAWYEYDTAGWHWKLTLDGLGVNLLEASKTPLSRWEDAERAARARAKQLGIKELI